MRTVSVFSAFGVCLLALGAVAKCEERLRRFRVDLSPDNQRRDVLAPDSYEWRIGEAGAQDCKIGELTFRLTSLTPSASLGFDWWKHGFDFPAALASDGALLASSDPKQPPILQLSIFGLPKGKHSIRTYHNHVSPHRIGDVSMQIHGKTVCDNLTPSFQVVHDDDAASIWGTFEVGDERETKVILSASVPANSAPSDSLALILNGFELDGTPFSGQASHPMPFDGDEHVNPTSRLAWKHTDSDATFRVYLGTSYEEVEQATPASPMYRGTVSTPEFSLLSQTSDRSQYNPHETYYWRIDAKSNGKQEKWVRGNVWRFRVRQRAFDGAEGHGMYARGGSGGRVMEVTNLNDSGEGSLRAAVEAEGPRIVIFRVGGTISLASKLVIRNPYLTVAGQTAPGDGICIRGYTFGCLGSHDVILRHLRIRVGDEAHLTMDGTGFASTDHSIMDHCSISWSIDEAVSTRGAANITVQKCIIAEALNIADHKKYQPGKGHSFAGSISGNIGSFHHNLVAHCAGRNWSLAGGLNRGGGFAGRLDIRNNVVFNWEHRTTDGGVKALQFVNNLYLPGPATRVFHLMKPDAGSPEDPQQYFVMGNVMEGKDYELDNWREDCMKVDHTLIPRIRLSAPFSPSWVTEEGARECYATVMNDVGANLPKLDAVDRRILSDVAERKTTFRGSRSGIPGIIDSQNDVGGWPELNNGTPYSDQDHDGIADSWEKAHGLNPLDPADARRWDDRFRTYLDRFLDDLAQPSNRTHVAP